MLSKFSYWTNLVILRTKCAKVMISMETMEMGTWQRPSPRPVFSDGIKEREGARSRSLLASSLSFTSPTHRKQLQYCKLATQIDASWLRANLFLDSTKIIFQTAHGPGCCLDLLHQQRRETLVHPSRWALASI